MKNTIKENQVYTFKLNSGEELVSKVLSITDTYVVIQEPVSIAPGPQGMGLVPSMFTANPKGEIKLNTNSIALMGETDDSVKVKYLEVTTGIKVPDKKIVMG
jgi:hypothetical protein